MIKSVNKLAQACGVTAPAAQKWLEHDTWKFGNGPWTEKDVERIKAWRSELQEDRSKAPGGRASGRDPQVTLIKQRAEAQLAVERAGYTKSKRRILDAELVDRAEFESKVRELNQKLTMYLISYVPTECVRLEEERYRQLGRPLTTLEKQDIIRTKIEAALRMINEG